MQDLSGAGQAVLGGSVPDSATAGRLTLGGDTATGLLHRGIPIGLVANAAAYTSPMQAIGAAIIRSRPRSFMPVSGVVSKYASSIGALGSAYGEAQPSARRAEAIADIGNAKSVGEAMSAAERSLAP